MPGTADTAGRQYMYRNNKPREGHERYTMRQIQLHDTGAIIELIDYETDASGAVTLDAVNVKKNGSFIALIEIQYSAKRKKPNMKIITSEDDLITGLPFMIGHHHFMSSVMHSILLEFTADHNEFNDAFRDEEGNMRQLPLLTLGF